MTENARPFHCEQCGAPLLGTPSGAVCPEGHGPLHQKLPKTIRRVNEAEYAGLPIAMDVPGGFVIGSNRKVYPKNALSQNQYKS